MTGSRRITAVAWVLVTAVSLAGAVLTVVAWGDLVMSDRITNLWVAPSAVLYATLGTLVVRRAGNVIGWLVLGVGAGLAIMASASAYAVLGIAHPGTLPGPELMALLAEWSFVPVFTAGQLDSDLALDRMASVLAAATGAVRVEVWIRVGPRLRPRVTWPPGSPAPAAVLLTEDGRLPVLDATRATAVRHTDELLGAITLCKPRNESVSGAEDKLLEHLASQAGLVLRNVRLTAELQARIDDLRASRRRLVQAQDAERQRIERNLHDGAQQQLVALTIQLTLLEDAAEDPGQVRQITSELRGGLRAALDDLRALARGICPPLLADQGLSAALQAQAGRAPLPVEIEADRIGRYPRDAEAAVYFCILEALQNVAKYARASRAAIALSRPDGHLEFTVTDDGDGFDTTKTTHGTGLQGMADRLAAMGGTLRVDSTPGSGTTISGALPVAELAR